MSDLPSHVTCAEYIFSIQIFCILVLCFLLLTLDKVGHMHVIYSNIF